MNARLCAAACLCVAGSASWAQGQVVQLPTFHNFSVQTSVSAPDRGGTHLGGVGRSSSRRSAYGVPGAGRLPVMGRLLGNRAIEQASGASNASVHATIIDNQELDRAVLAAAASRRSNPSTAEQRGAELARRMNGSSGEIAPGAEPLLSVAELRRQNEARRAAENAEVAQLLAQAQQAQQRGEISTARTYYRMAHKRAHGEQQRQIAARLEAMQNNDE
jgi:hypothetical protein